MMDIIEKLNHIAEIIEDKFTKLRITGAQVAVNSVSEISKHLGLFQSGELRFGNVKEPGKGFSGVRQGYPYFWYGAGGGPPEEWVMAAISNDVLNFGIRKDGTVYP